MAFPVTDCYARQYTILGYGFARTLIIPSQWTVAVKQAMITGMARLASAQWAWAPWAPKALSEEFCREDGDLAKCLRKQH